MTELERLAGQLAAAQMPADLFGQLSGTPEAQHAVAQSLFRRLARVAHADRYLLPEEKALAHTAFTTLNELWQRCQAQLKDGTYGVVHVLGTVASQTETFQLLSVLATGETSTVYLARPLTGPTAVVKVALSPVVNPFLEREVRTLRAVGKVAGPAVQPFLPTVRSAFLVKQAGGARRVSAFDHDAGCLPLPVVLREYPAGLDPRHAVWIFKRLLSVLATAHGAGMLHGAITPDHVLIRPADHAIRVVGWTFAGPVAAPLSAVSAKWQTWYPPEVFVKRASGPALDLYMASQIVNYVLASPPLVVPPTLHERFRRILRPCLLGNPAYRPTDAWAVLDDFDTAAKRVFGPPQFVPLTVAAKGV